MNLCKYAAISEVTSTALETLPEASRTLSVFLLRSATKHGLLGSSVGIRDVARMLRAYDEKRWRLWFARARRTWRRTAPFHRASWRLRALFRG